MDNKEFEPVLVIAKSGEGFKCMFNQEKADTGKSHEDILAAIFYDLMKRHDGFAESVIIASAKYYESLNTNNKIS